jgi:hypothetical protein
MSSQEISAEAGVNDGRSKTRTLDPLIKSQYIGAGNLHWNLNNIGVRSFILTGAPILSCGSRF